MARSKSELRATYERIADSFAASRREPWPEARAFIDSLPHGCRVLDLGSGNGRHSKLLAHRGHRVVALDFSRRLLEIGQSETGRNGHGTRIDWVEGEATMLPFRDACFDACLCAAVLHHLPTVAERITLLAELRRLLRRDAPALVSVWARDQPRFQPIVAARGDDDVEVPWTMPDGSRVPRFYHLFREGELERLIIESGLHGERFFRGAGNWFVLARRDG